MSKLSGNTNLLGDIVSMLEPRRPLFANVQNHENTSTCRGILVNTTGQLYLVQVTGAGDTTQKRFEAVQRYTDELLMDCVQQFIKPIKEVINFPINITSELLPNLGNTLGTIISSVEEPIDKAIEQINNTVKQISRLIDESNKFESEDGTVDLRIDIEFLGVVPENGVDKGIENIENILKGIIDSIGVLQWVDEINRGIGIIPASTLMDNLLSSGFIIDPHISNGTDVYDRILVGITKAISAQLMVEEGKIHYAADTESDLGPTPTSHEPLSASIKVSNHLKISNPTPQIRAKYSLIGGRLNYTVGEAPEHQP